MAVLLRDSMGFGLLSPSLYQFGGVKWDRSVRDGLIRVAARIRPPVVGSVPIEAVVAVGCSRIAIGSSSDPNG